MKKSLQDQPTKDGTKLPGLSPNLHHVPPLNEDVNEDSDPQGEQDQTSRLTQTHHRHQVRNLNADSKHRCHPLCQGETESRHRNEQNTDRDWIAANVGKVRYDSLRILGLREGATEGEVKAAYQAMSRIYHPDKHNSGFTGMSDEEAVKFFQHLNNAHSYLREIM
jgi:hypothetical protein